MNRGFACVWALLSIAVLSGRDHPAQFVWKDREGTGRQESVLFRRSFHLEEIPGQATLHLFADSRYHLWVNGTHIQFGPSRFYTANPEYDTYDLVPYLRTGENVVAVEVLTNGTITFQVPLSKGGFIAWGSAGTGTPDLDLKTPGKWKMHVPGAFDSDALRFSFACGPMEIFDGRNQPADWNRPGFDDSGWKSPVVHADQDHWGPLTPRTIPPLTQDETLPLELLALYGESGREEVYSFFIKTPDETRGDYNSGKQMYACTFIHSPADQEVEAGLWWGEHYLNGEGPLPVSGREAGNPVRQNRILALEQGWNFLMIDYVAIWGGWDFYMALPAEAGLVLSPTRSLDGGPFILTSGPHDKGIGLFNGAEDAAKPPREITGDKRYGWEPRENLPRGQNPARDLVWRGPDTSRNLKPDDYQVANFPAGEARFFVFDMGAKKLGRIFCKVDAPEGTRVDVGWSEDLNPMGLPFLYKRLQVNSGARFITSEGKRRYETFKPYGVRYLLVRIDPPDGGEAILEKAGVVSQVYPFEKAGSFQCSNPMLDRIWELGWRTLRVCAEDSYTDTPFRERGLYAGDALPQYGITLATDGDSRLLKRSLMLFQDMYRENLLEGKQEGLNDYVLKTLLLLDWYVQVTGDTEFLETLYPNYRSLMEFLISRKNTDGYYPTRRVFIEWTRINKNADLTAFQVLVAESFRIMSQMAQQLGKSGDAVRYGREADRLRDVIATHFWDEGTGLYRDGFDAGEPIDHHYPISSVYPLLFGIATPQQKAPVLEYLDTELRDIGEETRNRKITPYGSFYLFSALYREGRADIAERFMLQYWSRMIHQGDDTAWENFDIGSGEGGGQGTASHAWSGHPTFFLSTEVLGVNLGFTRPFDPARIEISPQSDHLAWARGTVPHPAGPVSVDWRVEGDRLEMEVVLPADIPYAVEPRGRLAHLDLDLEVKIGNSF